MMEAASTISVIICAYTEERWNDLVAAVESLQLQHCPPCEIIVVIDHNPSLLERAQKHIPGIIVLENKAQRGLSGARNSGVAIAQGTYIAFFDDDVIAEPDCLAWLQQYGADAQVSGVGGKAEPLWSEQQPAWFPEEFYWVIGCSYRGLPETRAAVRNPFGCCCCFRREVFEVIEGFRHEIGRVGKHPLGCEETELCIRAKQHWPQHSFMYEPRARIQHRIPAYRTSWHYFCSRCYAEGLSKAMIAQYVGARDALASERSYVRRTLPQGIVRGLRDALIHRDRTGLGRAAAIAVGLITTMAGYVVGNAALQLAKLRKQMKHLSNGKPAASAAPYGTLSYVPMRIVEVELGQPLLPISARNEETGHTYERALCLVRLHTQPLGMLELPLDACETPPNTYAQHIWNALGESILEHLQQDGLPPVTGLNAQGLGNAATPLCIEERQKFFASAPFVSVIVPTHERIELLRPCLQALMSLHYPAYEIIIVDSAPQTQATADFIRQTYRDVPRLHYICEERPGASEARNRGIMAARGEILAFTDDDAVVDPYWLIELVRAFSSADDVACVTGLILPLELETPSQFWFEEYGGFSKNFSRRVFDMAQHHPKLPLHPYTAGQFGSGVCMASTAAFLQSVNGFDPALGPGVPARAGEDLALFFQAIMHDHTLVYTPASLLYHLHRRDYTSLRQQMYNYGVGLAAFLTKNICDTPRLLFDFASKVPYGFYFTMSNRSSKNKKKSSHYPKELTRLELAGMLYGPFAYLRQRWSMRTRRKVGQPIKTPNPSSVAQIALFRRENDQRLLAQEEEQREKRRV